GIRPSTASLCLACLLFRAPYSPHPQQELHAPIRVYKTPEIRNVAVVGHGASGKTSLVDALAFVAGTSKRHGSVKDGTALTDYTPDEIERKYSINLAIAVAEWMDAKLNLIDTPGYLDFTGEALAGVYAADGAVVVVSATGGDDHDRSVRRVHARERLPREVEIARRVDQVELRVHPLGDRDGEIDGILAFDFVGGVIGEGGT